jgi:hypothetical protein
MTACVLAMAITVGCRLAILPVVPDLPRPALMEIDNRHARRRDAKLARRKEMV